MPEKRPRIDLFSDTKTRPSKGMLEAMMSAEVGDEQAGEDPTTIELCEKVANLLGKENALFLPSGTMCNQISIAIHCRPGDEIIADETSHIINFEVGGAASTAGAMIRSVKGTNGIFSEAQVENALRPEFRHAPKSRLIAVEQTSNSGGGSIWPIKRLEAIANVARSHNLLIHMDGARLMNAVVASNVSASEYAQHSDSVWIDLSKGLGCPIGGVLAGSADFIEEAWFWKQRLGGSMRQSGIIAAAGIYALENNVKRLAEDHENARLLASKLANVRNLSLANEKTETNILIVKLASSKIDAMQLASALLEIGIRVGPMDKETIRIVTHLDVDRDSVTEAGAAIQKIMEEYNH